MTEAASDDVAVAERPAGTVEERRKAPPDDFQRPNGPKAPLRCETTSCFKLFANAAVVVVVFVSFLFTEKAFISFAEELCPDRSPRFSSSNSGFNC